MPGRRPHSRAIAALIAGLVAGCAASATRQGAEFLQTRDLGTLETGKWADLVVLEGDPLTDILSTRRSGSST